MIEYQRVYEQISEVAKEQNGLPDRYYTANPQVRRLVEEIVDVALTLHHESSSPADVAEDILDAADTARDLTTMLEQIHRDVSSKKLHNENR